MEPVETPEEHPARMWIRPFPPGGPDSEGVVLAVDHLSADPGERMVGVLLNRGHEGGGEGVFLLLPTDLTARYRRTGDRLSVTLLAPRPVLAADLADRTDGLRDHLDALPADALDPDRVVLLHREAVTGFVPAASPDGGERQPVLLVDHSGGTPGPGELTALFEEGGASVTVVAAGFPDAGAPG
ncbi:hypothetical protein [Streptomyces griseus]|uniref:hypothetical protein n=1 Tax=Streptomyces griseus TaxID=1911 RepID=UPI00068EC674|nr:hypothetical protein [Streptomyces griseus]